MDGDTPKRRFGCLSFLALLLTLPLGFCGYVKWHEPRHSLPKEVEWSDVLAFGSSYGLREGCSFGVYGLPVTARYEFRQGSRLPAGWRQTPVILKDGQYADLGPSGGQITLYAHHATTCASATAQRYHLVEAYEGALHEPGNWVKIINGGEAMVLVAPRRGLAWFLNFG